MLLPKKGGKNLRDAGGCKIIGVGIELEIIFLINRPREGAPRKERREGYHKLFRSAVW